MCSNDFSVDASIARISFEIISLRAAIVALDIFKLYNKIHEKLSIRYGHENKISKIFDCRHIYNNHIIFAPFCEMPTTLINDYDTILNSLFKDNEIDFYIEIQKRNTNLQILLKKLKSKLATSYKYLYTGPYRKTTASDPRLLGLYIWDITNLEFKSIDEAVKMFRERYKEISGFKYKSIPSQSASLYLNNTNMRIVDGIFLSTTHRKCEAAPSD